MQLAAIPSGAWVSTYGVRVGYVDTDRAQVMHHATYLRYLEFARVEYLRERELDYRSFELERQLSLPVVEVNLRYHRPAYFDDQLEIKTWVGLVNRAKLRFDSLISRGDELLSSAQITLACVRMDQGRICSMPEGILALAPCAPLG